jgi:hypothetical protein
MLALSRINLVSIPSFHPIIRLNTDDMISEHTDGMDFRRMVLDRARQKNHLESRELEGPWKQAEDVNKDRGGG